MKKQLAILGHETRDKEVINDEDDIWGLYSFVPEGKWQEWWWKKLTP